MMINEGMEMSYIYLIIIMILLPTIRSWYIVPMIFNPVGQYNVMSDIYDITFMSVLLFRPEIRKWYSENVDKWYSCCYHLKCQCYSEMKCQSLNDEGRYLDWPATTNVMILVCS